MKKIIIILIILFIIFTYLSNLCKNPYKLCMVFGKKGSGKTTLLTKLAIKYRKKGYTVFSNIPIFGSERLNIKDLGVKRFPPNSVILIDEVSLIWSNRDFIRKDFRDEFRPIEKYFRLQRHYKHIVYLFSQSFDIDKKIRDLCDEMYLLKNIGGFLSIALKIRKVPTIHKDQPDENGKSTNEGFITEDYSYYLPFSWIFTFVPRYFKFFDSFDLDPEPVLKNRRRYKFENEHYLHQLTNFTFWITDLIHDKYLALKQRYIENKYSFKINSKAYFRLNIE